jgi:hypothetical protein
MKHKSDRVSVAQARLRVRQRAVFGYRLSAGLSHRQSSNSIVEKPINSNRMAQFSE